MTMEVISSDRAPAAIGPYSQGISVGNMLFTSGQIPINPATGEMVAGSIEEQARQVFENLKAVLFAGGANYKDVIKTTIYLKDMNDFAAINKVYGEYFQAPYPARSCVEVARLPKDANIEVEAVAVL